MSAITETITCECGAAFEWENSETDQFSADWLRPGRCPACQTAFDQEQEERQQREQEERIFRELGNLRQTILSATPQRPRETCTDHPAFNSKAWARLRQWTPTTEKPWLGLVGATGACKSRIAYLVAGLVLERMLAARIGHITTRECPRHPSFVFSKSYEITEKTMEQFGGTDEAKRKARAWLDRLRKADLALVDDLGKGKLSPAVAAEMFALVDHRHDHQLTTIWTSNSPPEIIAANLSDDMAGPFAGRLNESSKIFKFT